MNFTVLSVFIQGTELFTFVCLAVPTEKGPLTVILSLL